MCNSTLKDIQKLRQTFIWRYSLLHGWAIRLAAYWARASKAQAALYALKSLTLLMLLSRTSDI